jgi:hypothetical protein
MTIRATFFTPGVVTETTTTAHEEEENPPVSFELEETMPSQDPIPANGEGDDEDDDVTIIGLDNNDIERGGESNQRALVLDSIEQNGPEMAERRRNVLLRELRHMQRGSFIQFTLLCLIPTTLLIVVLATVLGGEDDCNSSITTCVAEARTFLNAYTTICICDAVNVKEG